MVQPYEEPECITFVLDEAIKKELYMYGCDIILEYSTNYTILDDVEREYLRNIISPFKSKIDTIELVYGYGNREDYSRICIYVDDDDPIKLPIFKTGTKYKDMKHYVPYTLEELGLK